MATIVRLFDPTATRHEPQGNQAQMPQTPLRLSGAVVGFIDNAKPNFHYLVDDLAELLVHTCGVHRIIRRRKPSASIPATAEIVAELAATCDLVIAGSGD